MPEWNAMLSAIVTIAAVIGALLILAGVVALVAHKMRLFREEKVTVQMRAIPDPRTTPTASVETDAPREARLRETSVVPWASRVVVLKTPVVTIGRSHKNDIVLASDAVSAEHCRLERHGASFRLVDLGSTNKTWVNGSQVEDVVLRDGDQIRVGDTTFAFEWSGENG